VKPIAGSEVCRLLESSGWRLERIKGSHHIYSKSGERRIIVVPVHGNQMLKPGLAHRIARDSGIRW
jgi:predicted RNA binding protein YcfA (HicA-like mRNA interferase family)